MEVSIPKIGVTLGTIEQDGCDSTYSIRDEEGKLIHRVQGPCYAVCAPCCFWCCNEHHEVNAADGVTELGTVRRHWRDFFKEHNGDMGVSFSEDLPTQNKALFIGFFVLIVS